MLFHSMGTPAASHAPASTLRLSPTGHPDESNTGHLRHPSYPGSLTAGGTISAGQTYEFKDYSGADVLAANVTFIGCRFRSNAVESWNVLVQFTGAGTATFSYCTFCPEPADVTEPPNKAWPSAGAGASVEGGDVPAYMIDITDSYQYGIRNTDGAIAMDHCDMWGFGNAVDLHTSDGATITDCWIHDASHEGPAVEYHQDGPGYLDGGGGLSNITIDHCTIASLGNTNAIAFQAATSAYSNVAVTDCYISGFANTVDMCHNATGNNNLTFTGNIIGTDIRWRDNPLYANYTTQFNGATNLWQNNTLRVLPGTTPAPGASTTFVSGDNGKYILPNGTFSVTDFE